MYVAHCHQQQTASNTLSQTYPVLEIIAVNRNLRNEFIMSLPLSSVSVLCENDIRLDIQDTMT